MEGGADVPGDRGSGLTLTLTLTLTLHPDPNPKQVTEAPLGAEEDVIKINGTYPHDVSP